MQEEPQSLQERYAPGNACFGCGPANDRGLRLRSFPEGDEVVCRWAPEPHHEAFPNVLNGGICGTLLDCHSNWTAAWHLMRAGGLEGPPCTVTADFHVKLRRLLQAPGVGNAQIRHLEFAGAPVGLRLLPRKVVVQGKPIGERINGGRQAMRTRQQSR